MVTLTQEQEGRLSAALARARRRYGVAQPLSQSRRIPTPPERQTGEPELEFASPSIFDRTIGRIGTILPDMARGIGNLVKEPVEMLGAGAAAIVDPGAEEEYYKELEDVKTLATDIGKSIVGTAGRIPIPIPVPIKLEVDPETGKTIPMLGLLTPRGVVETMTGPETGIGEISRIAGEEAQRYYDAPLDAAVEDIGNISLFTSLVGGVAGKAASTGLAVSEEAAVAGNAAGAARWASVASKASKIQQGAEALRIGNLFDRTAAGTIQGILEQKALNLRVKHGVTLGDVLRESPKGQRATQLAHRYGITTKGRALRRSAIESMSERVEAFRNATRGETEARALVKQMALSTDAFGPRIRLTSDDEMLNFLDTNAEEIYNSSQVVGNNGFGHRVRLLHDRLWAESLGLPRNIVEHFTAIRMQYDNLADMVNNPAMTSSLPDDDLAAISDLASMVDPDIADHITAYVQAKENIGSLDDYAPEIDRRYIDYQAARKRVTEIDDELLNEAKNPYDEANKGAGRRKQLERLRSIEEDITTNPAPEDVAARSAELGKRINDQRDFLRQQILATEKSIMLKEGLIPSRTATKLATGEYVFATEAAQEAYANIYRDLSRDINKSGLGPYVGIKPKMQAKLVSRRATELLKADPEYQEIISGYVSGRKQAKKAKLRLEAELQAHRELGAEEKVSKAIPHASGKGWEVHTVASEIIEEGDKPAIFGRPRKGETIELGKNTGMQGEWRVEGVYKDSVRLVQLYDEAVYQGIIPTGETRKVGFGERTLRRYNKGEISDRARVTTSTVDQTPKWKKRQAFLENELRMQQDYLDTATQERSALTREFKAENLEQANKDIAEKIAEVQAKYRKAEARAQGILNDPTSYASPERVYMRVNRAAKFIQDHLDSLKVSETTKKQFAQAEILGTLDDLNRAGVRVEYLHSKKTDYSSIWADVLPPTSDMPPVVRGVTSKQKKSSFRQKEGLMTNPERDVMLRINAHQLDTALEVIERRYLKKFVDDYGISGADLTSRMSSAQKAEFKRILKRAEPGEIGIFLDALGYEVWDAKAMTGLRAPKNYAFPEDVYMPKWVRGQVEAQFAGDYPFFSNGIGMAYDKAQGAWKTSVLALAPRWHVNNMFGGAFLSWAMGDVPLAHMPKLWMDSIRTYRNGGLITAKTAKNLEGWLRKATEGKIGVESLPDLLGYHPLSRASSPVVAELAPVGKSGIDIATHEIPVGFKESIKHPVRASKKFNALVDNIVRSSVYLEHVIKSVDDIPQVKGLRSQIDKLRAELQATHRTQRKPIAEKLDAAERQLAEVTEPIIDKAVEYGNHTLGHFKKLGRNERYLLRRMFPFYVWLRHMGHTAFRMLKPENLNRTLMLAYIAEIYGKPDEVEEKLPAWMHSYMNMDFATNGEPVFLNLHSVMPYSDITRPVLSEGRISPAGALQSVSPIIRRPLELAGVKFPGPQLLPTKKEITPSGDIQEVGPGFIDMLSQDIAPVKLTRQVLSGNQPQFATGDPIIYKGAKAQPTAFAITSYLGAPLRTANPSELAMKNYKNQMKALRSNIRFQKRVLRTQGKSQQETLQQLSRLPQLPRRPFEPSR